MKLPIILSIIFFIVIGIAVNIYFLELTIMPFIGVMLTALIVLFLIINFSKKINQKRKGIVGEPDAFIFPDATAKKMKEVSLDIQYEASVISTAALLLGILMFVIYFTFFTTSSWVMKGMVIFNSLCGFGLLGGMLITFYQQLVSYKESTKFLNNFAVSQRNGNRKKKEIEGERIEAEEIEGEIEGDYYA